MREKIDVPVPAGKSGAWEVTHFEISEEEAKFYNLRCMIKGEESRIVEAGKYTRLTCHNHVIMSNTQAEVNDHSEFFREAEKRGGDILINGLGLGVILVKLLTFDNIKSITVVEESSDVIKLTGPSYKDHPKINIIHADAYKYEPEDNKHFTCVWHDIWPDICSDNLEEMETLFDKYRDKCDWQGAWAKELCEKWEDRKDFFNNVEVVFI